jgi:hypothetical protein
MRAGNNRIARRSANNASNVIPTRRNGSDRSHTSGHSTSASKAIGQHRTNRMHQTTKTKKGFMEAPVRAVIDRIAAIQKTATAAMVGARHRLRRRLPKAPKLTNPFVYRRRKILNAVRPGKRHSARDTSPKSFPEWQLRFDCVMRQIAAQKFTSVDFKALRSAVGTRNCYRVPFSGYLGECDTHVRRRGRKPI